MTINFVKPIRLPEMGGKGGELEAIFLIKGIVLVFSSCYNWEQDLNLAYMQKIDAADGTLIGAPKEIDRISAYRRGNRGSFDFILSQDSSTILVTHHDPFDKYSDEKFSYKLLDASGTAIWDRNLELPYKDKYFEVSNYMVSKKGQVFMLASVTKEKTDREEGKPHYVYNLISYDPASRRLKELEVSLGDQYISCIRSMIMPDQTIVLAGFYSEKNSEGIAGTFFISVNPFTNTILRKAQKEFDVSFLSEFMSARRAGKHMELYEYMINQLLPKPSGGISLVAERFYVQVITSYNQRGGTSVSYHYHYDHLIVVDMNYDGTVNWTRKIEKLQVSANDGGPYSSYALTYLNGHLNFIYNDHPKNLNPKTKMTRNGVGKKMVTVVSTLNPEGILSKIPLFSSKTEKVYSRPKVFLQLDNSRSLLYTANKKRFRFAIISF